MKLRISRTISIGTFTISLILFIIDGSFVHRGYFNGIGILSTFILPPLGIVLAIIALNKTGYWKDMVLLWLNVIAFLSFFLFMFFGTLIFGP